MKQVKLLGIHCSVSGGLHLSFDEAEKLGIDTFQIFTQNQRQWINKKYDQETIDAFKKAWKASKVKTVFSHCSYLLNLASEDETLRNKSIDALTGEVQRIGVDLGWRQHLRADGNDLGVVHRA